MMKKGVMILALLLLFSSVAYAIPTNGTTYWKFENSGADQWYSNTATLSGATYSANYPTYNTTGDGNNKSSSYDGTNDYTYATYQPVTTGDKTISWWMYINSAVPGTFQAIAQSTTGELSITAPNAGYLMYYENTGATLNMKYGNGATTDQYCKITGISVSKGVYFHYAMKMNSSGCYAYINGVLAGSDTTLSGTEQAPDNIFTFGKVVNADCGTNCWFEGQIDEAQFFNRSLTDSEILQLYNTGEVTTPSPSPENYIAFSSPTTANGSIQRLSTAPTIEINASANITNLTSINLIIENDAGIVYNQTYTGTPPTPPWFNISYTAAAYGNYSYYAMALNNTGGSYSTGTYTVYFYEIVPPVLTFPINGSLLNDPFNITYTEANVTDNRTTVTNYTLSWLNSDYSLNYYIGNNDLSLIKHFDFYHLNLSLGNYRLFVKAIDSAGEEANSSSLITITKNAQLNITGWYTTTPIQAYTATLTDHQTAEVIQVNVSNYLGSTGVIYGHNYSVFLDPSVSGYAYHYANITIDSFYDFYNASIWPANSVYMRFYNVTNILPVYQNVTFQLSGPSYYTNTTNAGFYLQTNITPGTYTGTFSSAGFQENDHILTIGNNSFQYLDVYFSPSSTNEVVFTLRDYDSAAIIENVLMSIEQYVNGSYVLTGAYYSDITGRIQYTFTEGANYRFTLSKTGYQTKQFTLDPIIFGSYTVRMKKDVSQNNTFDYSQISIVHSPENYFNGATNNISILFFTPYGLFTKYNYTAEVTGTNWNASGSGTNAYGSSLTGTLHIIGANLSNKVKLTYHYSLSTGVNKTYIVYYDILNSDPNISSFFTNKDNPYGLPLYDRVLILVIICIVAGGVAMWFGGAPAAGGTIMLIFGYLIAIGFVSRWFGLIPIILLILLAMRWSQ